MVNLKHVGRMKANGRKVIVAYRTLPGDSDSALVVQTESLSPEQHDAIMKLVESPAGQSSYEFAEIMARASFPDGSVMLANLHTSGRLNKVKTSDVEMVPSLQAAISLDQLNQIIAEQRGISVNDLALGNTSSIQDIAKVEDLTEQPVSSEELSEFSKTTSASVNESVETVAKFDSPEAEAKFYRSQADKLAKQAAEMRRKAEELAPTKKKAKETA